MSVTRRVLGVVVILGLAAPAAAEPARDAAAWCSAHPGEVLVRDAAGVWHRIADDRPRDDDEGRLTQAWRGKLDPDGREDLVLRSVAGCGTRECPIEAFVSCPDGTYSRVLGPVYGDKVKVTRKRGWGVVKVRTVGEDPEPAKRYLWTPYRFAADGYAE